jgi:hypothetical protein
MKLLNGKTRGALFSLALSAVSTCAHAEMVPKGWIKAGSVPQLYEVSLFKNTDGRSAVSLRSTGGKSVFLTEPAPANPFGTLMQTIASDAYAGKRLRLTATVSADGVLGWAGLWMRVDGARGKTLGFDNMEKHPIKGSTDPKKYSVVLDVPANAQSVSYGILLTGAGAVTLWGVRVETVGKDVPTTSGPVEEPLPTKPQNLDFSE